MFNHKQSPGFIYEEPKWVYSGLAFAYDWPMNQPQLNSTPVYRRLSQVGLSVGLLIVVLNMWIGADTNTNTVQSNMLSALTRQLSQQSALMAEHLIAQKQLDGLTPLLNNLVSNPYIQQSVIYDHNGKVMAQSDGAVSAIDIYHNQIRQAKVDIGVVDEIVDEIADEVNDEMDAEIAGEIDAKVDSKIDNNVNTKEDNKLDNKTKPVDSLKQLKSPKPPKPDSKSKVYITEIVTDNQVIGYLRINYLQQQALKPSQLRHKETMREILLMMILAGIIGFMLTRGFSRFSRLSFRVKQTTHKSLPTIPE